MGSFLRFLTYSFPLAYMFIVVPVLAYFVKILQYSLKSGIVLLLVLFLLFKIALAIWGLLYFYMNFRIVFLEILWDFVGLILNLYIALGNVHVLMILILPMCEH